MKCLQSELHTHALHLVLHRAEGERLRLTVRDLVQEVARECQKRIENYKELQKKIEDTVAEALDQAPWTQEQKK